MIATFLRPGSKDEVVVVLKGELVIQTCCTVGRPVSIQGVRTKVGRNVNATCASVRMSWGENQNVKKEFCGTKAESGVEERDGPSSGQGMDCAPMIIHVRSKEMRCFTR